eukprot:GHUV01009911.1.p3 GENE.GHUV01009911.1~~GHUV01009911.1.p3  ORF type:complete len:103 (+),score=10.81 GHUV01009911.1:810-1118(+)
MPQPVATGVSSLCVVLRGWLLTNLQQSKIYRWSPDEPDKPEYVSYRRVIIWSHMVLFCAVCASSTLQDLQITGAAQINQMTSSTICYTRSMQTITHICVFVL